MITLACLKNVLEMEGFSNNGNKYIYMFDNGEKIEVDFIFEQTAVLMRLLIKLDNNKKTP